MSITSHSLVASTQLKNCLVITVGDDLGGDTLDEIRRLVLEGIGQTGCEFVILELTMLKYIDGGEFESLVGLSKVALILGAKTIFVGLTVGVILHLMSINMDTEGISAAVDLDSAFQIIGITEV